MDKDLESYRNQLASNPDDAEALSRLESALVRTHDWQGLIALTAERAEGLSPPETEAAWTRLVESLEQHVASLDEPEVASALALAVGLVWEDRLGRPDQAMLRYQRAFQLDAKNLDALHRARQSYIARENWDLVWQLYTLELDAVVGHSEAQSELLFEMAEICAHRLDRPGDAVKCVRQALKLVPDHPRAADFSDLLDSVHKDREVRFEELRASAEATRDPRQRAAMLVEAASLWMEESPDDHQIEALLKEVLSADPRNEHARQLLQEYYESNALWDELTSYLVGRAEATARKADRLAVYQRLATIAQHEMADADKAVEWHREVLKLNPVEQDSLGFCVDYYSGAERWHDLVGVYEAALRTRHRGGNESAMLVQIAMILWRKIEDLEQAESYFKRIKLNDPRNGLMLQFYSEFYAARKDWKRLLGTLAARQGNEEATDRKIVLGLEMARVAEEELGNHGKAIDIWKSILKLDATHQVARDALRRLFFHTRKWNALLELLKEDLTLVEETDTGASVALYEEMIGIYRDQLNLPVMVINTYNQILQVDPTNGEALDALQQKYESSARWNDLIGILKRRADAARHAGDEDSFTQLYRQIAQLWLEKFSNPNQAIQYLEGILELRPADEPTIAQLIDIYRHRKDWRALYTTYGRQLELLEGTDRVERLVEMAKIASNRLDEKAEAIDLWRRVVDVDPTHDAAWQALESLYQKTERWGDLAGLFEAQAGRADEEAQQLGWLKKLGNIYAERLGDEDRAAETWRAVMRINSDDLHAESYLRELYLQRGDWTSLETLYGERGDWEGFIRLLGGAADASDDTSARVDLYKRMARVCAVNLGNELAAVECWERILAEDSDNVDAARTLAPHYQRAEAWEPLVTVYEVLLRNEPAEPLELMIELAHVHEHERGEPGDAYEWYARALQAQPDRVDLLGEVARTAAAAGRHEGLVDLLDVLVGSLEAPDAEVRFRRVLAATCAGELGRSADAAAHYERIRALDGESDDVLAALCDLYQKLGDWDALQGVYTGQLDRADEPADQARILAAIGELQENVSDDAHAAREAYERLRALDATNLPALRGLQRLAERTEDTRALAEYVAAELELTLDGDDRVSLLFRIGQLSERQGDLEDAVDAYARVLALAPEHAATVQALETFLDTGQAARAARVLEPYMRAHEQWSSLRSVLELQVADSSDAEFRVRTLREVAEIREERLSDPRGAFVTYRQLLAEDRTAADVRASLERIAGELAAWEELAELYSRFALAGDMSDDDIETNALYSRRLASLQEERLASFDEARATLELVLEELGDDLRTLDRLDHICTRLEDWTGLVDVCERRIPQLEDPDVRIETLFRIGDLHEVFLEDTAAAVEVYRRVLADVPGHQRAVDALERIFRNAGRFEDLADLLESRLADAEGEARVPLAYQLGQVLEGHLERPADALERYAEVLDDAPDHEPSERAIQALIETHSGSDGEDRALRSRACDVLEPIYTGRGDWQSRIHLLQVRLGDAAGAPDRVGLHVAVARLYELEAGDQVAAFGSYGAAFDEQYGNPEVLAELERIAGELGHWEGLAMVLRGGLDAGGRAMELDPGLKREMLGRVAALYEERVGDPGRAVVFNMRILADDPGDGRALESLDRLYGATGDAAQQVEVIERRIDLSLEPSEQARLSFRLGALLESPLEDPARAIEVYRRVRMDIDPTDLRAHDALERLYATVGQYEPLVGVLRDHADQLEDLGEKKQRLVRAAATLEHALERREDAVEVYREVAELDETDTHALGNLDRLYTGLERWIDLLDVLGRELELAADDDARNTFEYRTGLLFRDHLGEAERAVESLRSVLARDPGHAEARVALESMLQDPVVRLAAARILMPLYEASEAWSSLRHTLRGTLQDLDDVEAQIEALQRVALIEEGYLGQSRAAFDSLAEAYRMSEANVELESELERLAGELDHHAALADLLADVVGNAPARSTAIHLKIAALAETRLDDVQRAIGQHRDVLDADPENRTALDALERLYERVGEYQSLVDTLERKCELAEDAERPRLLGRIALICETELADPSAAIETWRRRLVDNEADAEALDHLERLLQDAERWPELAALYEHRLTATEDGAELAEFEYRLARVCETRLQEGARALDLYRQVLDRGAAHGGARAALGALFASEASAEAAGVERLDVASLLEPLYRGDGDHPALVPVLEARQAAMHDDPHERVRLLREIAALREAHLDDAEGAFETCGRVLALAPGDVDNREDLHRLGEVTGAHARLSALLEDAAADATETELRCGLLIELGLVEEMWRENHERARDAYREVLEIDPGNSAAMGALVSLFTQTHAWEDLVQLHLDRAAASMDPDEQKELYFKVCQLLVDVVDDPDRAIETYRKVLEIEPDNADASRALERFYTQGERWNDLADLLRDEIQQTVEEAPRADLRNRLADVLETHLDDLAGAIEAWRSALQGDVEGHGPSVDALERLLIELDGDPPDPLRRRAAEILEPLYESREQWADWVMAVEVQLAFQTDRWQRMETLVRVAGVHEAQLRSPTNAFEAYGRAFACDYGNPDLQTQIDRLGAELNAWRPLVEVYLTGIEGYQDLDSAVEILLKVAAWFDEKLEDVQRSIETYRRVLVVDETNVVALAALERILQVNGRHHDLVGILNRKADLATDVIEKKDLLYRVCEIWEQVLDRPDQAIDTYRRVFEEDPEDQNAIEALIRLYETTAQWPLLVEVLREKLEVEAEDDTRKTILFRIARTYEEQLQDVEETILSYRSVLELDALDQKAIEALERLYSREGRWGELIDLLEGQRDEFRDSAPAKVDETELRIADVLEHQLGQVAQAIDLYGDVLGRSPENGDARGALERLLSDQDHRLLAGRVLEPYYRERDQPEALARIYELQLLDLDDRSERLELLKRLGKLRYEVLKHPPSAFDSYARAFREDPADPDIVDALHDLADELKTHEELAAIYVEQAASTLDAEVARNLNRRLARLLDSKLARHDDAVLAWQAVLGADGYDAEALEALDRLYQESQNWGALTEVLRRRIDISSDDDAEVSDLRFRLGYLLEVVESDVAGAIELYRGILWENPAHGYSREAMERLAVHAEYRLAIADVLEPIYTDQAQWDKLAILTEMRIELARDARERAQLWVRSAELREQELGDADSALESILNAFRELPQDHDVRAEVVRIATERGAWSRLVEAFEAAQEQLDDPDLQLEDRLRIADWARGRLRDEPRAIASYQAALELDGDNERALDALQQLYQSAGNWAALARVYRQRADALFDLDEKKARLHALGELSADKLGDIEGAVAAYAEVLDIDDADARALGQLETLHTRAEDWSALYEVLARRAETVYDGPELARIHRRMGDLARVQLADGELAAESYEKVLEFEPESVTAMSALRELYEAGERWDRLQQVLVKELAIVEDESRRVEVLRALGYNADTRLDNPDDAVEYYRQVLGAHPHDAETLAGLERLYERTERWFDLVEALREHVTALRSADDTQALIPVLVRIARVAEGRLQDADLAIESLNEVRALDPNHAGALNVLARLYERNGEWEKTAETLEQAIEHAGEGPDRAEAWRRLGLLYLERLDRPEDARRALESAVAETGDAEALDALVTMAREAGDDAEVVTLLQRRLQGAEGDARVGLLTEIAGLRKKTGDAAGAVVALEEAFQLAPDDLEVADGLLEAYFAADRHADAEPILHVVIDKLKGARRFKELFAYNYRMGCVAEASGDIAQALAYYTECFDYDATYVPNLLRLGGLHYAGERWEQALKIFQTVLLHQMKLEKDERVDVFHKLGRIRLALGDARKAKDMFNRALGLDPDHAPSREARDRL